MKDYKAYSGDFFFLLLAICSFFVTIFLFVSRGINLKIDLFILGTIPWGIIGGVLVMLHPWKLADMKYWHNYNNNLIFKNWHENIHLFYKILSVVLVFIQIIFILAGIICCIFSSG